MNVTVPMLKAIPTGFDGLFLFQPRIFTDDRGAFLKTFNTELFNGFGIEFEPQEEFFSLSAKNILRGMHFQLPPAAHAKLVYCVAGRVLDVVVDLRNNSKTFGRAFSRELNASNCELLFISKGFAHGFLALEDNSLMIYKTDTVYSPAQDAGILWNSFGFDWPMKNPILSARDKSFPSLHEFQSPFLMT
jgi:dTDP-4-dehydrorhamnose 3,5-epimerase/CDP-3, 6-dideoxy-D-glycero-D-glycero-4-hexulose-5-epimerase